MITRNYTFFCSLLGIVIINALAQQQVFLVGTAAILAVIWLAAGFRYMVYGVSIYILLSLPIELRLAFTLAESVPILYTNAIDFAHMGPPPAFAMAVLGNPLGEFCLLVIGIFAGVVEAKVIGRMVLSRVDWQRLRRR